MRNRFDEQLEQLNVGLIKMGALCEESIACAVKALFDEKTSEMIAKVNDNEEETDHMEHDIEALCMKLLLHQQPVAKDLRCVHQDIDIKSEIFVAFSAGVDVHRTRYSYPPADPPE